MMDRWVHPDVPNDPSSSPAVRKPIALRLGCRDNRLVAVLFLMVGLAGAGKTTRARELAPARRALLLSLDEWMKPLFGAPDVGGKQDVLEGRLISVALAALRLGTSVVLDFGFWSQDERSSLRSLAASAGASCQVVYVPVDRETQLERIARRARLTPEQTYPMTEADVDRWRTQFEAPDRAELEGGEIPAPPAGCPGWPEWAVGRWPSLVVG
jgi:predicted kinase